MSCSRASTRNSKWRNIEISNRHGQHTVLQSNGNNKTATTHTQRMCICMYIQERTTLVQGISLINGARFLSLSRWLSLALIPIPLIMPPTKTCWPPSGTFSSELPPSYLVIVPFPFSFVLPAHLLCSHCFDKLYFQVCRQSTLSGSQT